MLFLLLQQLLLVTKMTDGDEDNDKNNKEDEDKDKGLLTI